jgi:hypothetical protein
MLKVRLTFPCASRDQTKQAKLHQGLPAPSVSCHAAFQSQEESLLSVQELEQVPAPLLQLSCMLAGKSRPRKTFSSIATTVTASRSPAGSSEGET